MLRRIAVFVAVLILVSVAAIAPAMAHTHHHHHHHRRHHHSSHSSSSSDTSSGDSGSTRSGATTESNDDSSVSDLPAASGDKSAAMAGPAAPMATGSAQTINARLTGFSWQDNTPPGSSTISMPVLHKVASGTGTFADPITTAVPGHAGSGVETAKGTKIYVPKLKRYFIVEDSGATKVSGTKHFDLWVGGQGFSKAASDKCESSYTGTAQIIVNPPPSEPVTVGPLTGPNGCNI